MTISFITFMYGFGMPILFPIACVSFLVLYMVEKLMLFYAYRLPPMYDERLSNDVLNKLQFGPILYLAFGYWMASNNQLISNDHLTPKVNQRDVFESQHTFESVFTQHGGLGFEWPLLVSFFVLCILYCCGSCVESLLYKCCESIKIGDIADELNEDIDNYWAALDSEDRKWSECEEANARKLPTSAILTDTQYSRLREVPMTKGKTLQGVHSYDMLSNPLYFDDFQYITAAEDRASLIFDGDDNEGDDAAQSDLVRVALNLAFMTEQEARDFKFSSEHLTKLKDDSGNTMV